MHGVVAALLACPCEFTCIGFSAFVVLFFEKVSDPSVPSAGLAVQCTHIIHLPAQRATEEAPHGGLFPFTLD